MEAANRAMISIFPFPGENMLSYMSIGEHPIEEEVCFR